jgi:hypothetical protein
MRRHPLTNLLLAAAVLGLAACAKDSAAPASLIDDAQVTADVASDAGDAIATDVQTMLANEVFAALPTPGISFDLFGTNGNTFSFTRTRTCYDAAHAEVANCSPATTRTIVIHVTLDGSRTGVFLSGAVHRLRDLTITRNFDTAVPATEVSRTHDGVGTSADTLTYANATTGVTRVRDEAAVDSVVAVTWNLPHATNPWPVSGAMIRNVSLHVTADSPTGHDARDETRRVEVDYPADAQGNVVLHINDQTCTLNLVTHAVTGCH